MADDTIKTVPVNDCHYRDCGTFLRTSRPPLIHMSHTFFQVFQVFKNLIEITYYSKEISINTFQCAYRYTVNYKSCSGLNQCLIIIKNKSLLKLAILSFYKSFITKAFFLNLLLQTTFKVVQQNFIMYSFSFTVWTSNPLIFFKAKHIRHFYS